jgi:hypothetical protein
MANTAAQFGFKPQGFLSGGSPDFQLTPVAIQSTNATKIFFGDPVSYGAASSYIVQAIGTGSLSAIVGIFQGCQFTPSTGGPPQWSPWWPGAANADAVGYIANAPNQKMLVAALLTAVPVTAIGRNIGYSTGAGGTTVGGGFSTFTVDQSTITATITVGAFRVLGMYPGVGNGSDTTTNFNWVVVGFNPNNTAPIT